MAADDTFGPDDSTPPGHPNPADRTPWSAERAPFADLHPHPEDLGPPIDDDHEVPSADERAAARAFLQRSEVRLSTVHRVASALLSGAGLLVLLPAVARDSVITVLRALLTGPADVGHLLSAAAIATSLCVPLAALWVLLRDLAHFYFHGNHIGPHGRTTFAPRFTLTALRLPPDELQHEAHDQLDATRRRPHKIELLVAPGEAERVDRRLAAYGGLGLDPDHRDDLDRANALLELAASRPRSLLDEVAKVEYGMARHVLRIQTIVLRYLKALLALLTTAVAVFVAAGIVEHHDAGNMTLDAGQSVWLAAVVLLWVPAVLATVTSPIRWLESSLRHTAATSALADDPEFTQVETVTVRLALLAFLLALGSMAAALQETTSDATRYGGVAALLVATTATAGLLGWWRRSRRP